MAPCSLTVSIRHPSKCQCCSSPEDGRPLVCALFPACAHGKGQEPTETFPTQLLDMLIVIAGLFSLAPHGEVWVWERVCEFWRPNRKTQVANNWLWDDDSSADFYFYVSETNT